MASISATSLRFKSSLKLPSYTSQASSKISSLRTVSVGWTRRSLSSLRTSSFSISCAAQPETVQKVCEVVRKQLALAPESELTPETKFSALGADSLDTVEIVMSLEEEFGINVEEENSESITTVQEAADLIEKLVQKKGGD
ncbi:acyl carrier protein 1, chloroplastic-like [Gastrolobium bilobum]|uniref:acyl carrier protein 1, chloroplastic-like n=1 Tax=Gastrolobium bilobum TaxID=150636 RepID=UPI002AB21CF4|nr:acyl carrier protein 1, chloroplastic-like [Gastrolobium bilobum]